MNEYENIAFTQDGITIKLFQQVNKPLTVPDTPHKHIANKQICKQCILQQTAYCDVIFFHSNFFLIFHSNESHLLTSFLPPKKRDSRERIGAKQAIPIRVKSSHLNRTPLYQLYQLPLYQSYFNRSTCLSLSLKILIRSSASFWQRQHNGQ